MINPKLPEYILSYKGIELRRTKDDKAIRWVNAFSSDFVGSGAKNLYATETLFGDWSGEILLLAQDALPARALDDLIALYVSTGKPRENAWRHADKEKYGDKKGWRTNESIKALMLKYAENCGAVYGSAAAHMLYSDGGLKYRQNLVGFTNIELTNHLTDVLRWVVSSMPNLKYVMCLGEHAWRISLSAAGVVPAEKFSTLRDGGVVCPTSIGCRSITIIPAFHPMAMKSNLVKEKPWQILSALLNKKNIPLNSKGSN